MAKPQKLNTKLELFEVFIEISWKINGKKGFLKRRSVFP